LPAMSQVPHFFWKKSEGADREKGREGATKKKTKARDWIFKKSPGRRRDIEITKELKPTRPKEDQVREAGGGTKEIGGTPVDKKRVLV